MCQSTKSNQYIKESRIAGYCLKYNISKTLPQIRKDKCISKNNIFCEHFSPNNKNTFLNSKKCRLLIRDYPKLYNNLQPLKLVKFKMPDIDDYDIYAYFDASLNIETKSSGLSFVITDKNDNYIHENLVQDYCSSSNEAEFKSLEILISYIDNNKDSLLSYGKILILGDSKEVISILEGNRKPKDIDRNKQIELKNRYLNLKENYGILIRWIKGKDNKLADKLSKSMVI